MKSTMKKMPETIAFRQIVDENAEPVGPITVHAGVGLEHVLIPGKDTLNSEDLVALKRRIPQVDIPGADYGCQVVECRKDYDCIMGPSSNRVHWWTYFTHTC